MTVALKVGTLVSVLVKPASAPRLAVADTPKLRPFA